MRIDIDGLTEAELIDLNNRVVERLKFLRHMRAHAQMLEFSIGDRVSFQPDGRPLQDWYAYALQQKDGHSYHR
jgi:hypothetical protein